MNLLATIFLLTVKSHVISIKAGVVMNISFTKLNIETMLFTFASSSEEGEKKIVDYANTSNIKLGERYDFAFNISQKGVKNSVKLVYYVVPKGTLGKGDIKAITFKSDDFLKLTLSEDEFNEVLDGKKKDAIEDFLKEKKLRLDISTIVGIYKNDGNEKVIYMQYKTN